MTTMHTPGPWKRQPGNNFITDAAGIVVCEMHRHHTDQQVAFNAKLIAAAPDMFEALHKIVCLYGERSSENELLTSTEQDPEIAIAMDALDKAQGVLA